MIIVAIGEKYLGSLIEYLDEGHLRPALVVREQGNQVVTLDASGRERPIARELVMVRYLERRPKREQLAEALAALERERAQLATELDLGLLWEVVREHERAYSAEELAELFFGRRAPITTAVTLDALFADRLYFVRRHMDFLARGAEQVERLRLQYERMRLRSESGRRLRSILHLVLENGIVPSADEAAPMVAELRRYLENPFTRSRELTALLEATTNEMTPAEAAYEILDRLAAAPAGPRFAVIGGLRRNFGEAALAEVKELTPPLRPTGADTQAITIDDEETLEIDDALSCELLGDGQLRVRIHIALVADFIARGGAVDNEAAARGATVYLPETTVRMLPDPISTDAASLIAGVERHVLTTEVTLSPGGEMAGFSLYPEVIRVRRRLSYEQADRILSQQLGDGDGESQMLRRMAEAADHLRERRREAGAILVQRREPKIHVSDGQIEVKVIDNSSPSRQLVAEFMVLSNHCAARLAAERGVPIIYRVQPASSGEPLAPRPRLSLYPEFHTGVGVDRYSQLSSPIRRYMDLVLQRQMVAALADHSTVYEPGELLGLLANAENNESDGRELERRAKRYWLLRYLDQHARERPLEAIVLRDGASAELEAYVVRGALHGAPNIASHCRVLVRIGRIDPVRGWLTLDYLSTLPEAP